MCEIFIEELFEFYVVVVVVVGGEVVVVCVCFIKYLYFFIEEYCVCVMKWIDVFLLVLFVLLVVVYGGLRVLLLCGCLLIFWEIMLLS